MGVECTAAAGGSLQDVIEADSESSNSAISDDDPRPKVVLAAKKLYKPGVRAPPVNTYSKPSQSLKDKIKKANDKRVKITARQTAAIIKRERKKGLKSAAFFYFVGAIVMSTAQKKS